MRAFEEDVYETHSLLCLFDVLKINLFKITKSKIFIRFKILQIKSQN